MTPSPRDAATPADPLIVPGAPFDDPSPKNFRDAMARLGSAVTIVTTLDADGPVGFTATAVCSISDDPASLLVCLNRSASVAPRFQHTERLCVNVLSTGQQHISKLFGGKTPMSERFAAAAWQTLHTGAPALVEALASFDCHVTSRVSSGTHDVLICQVQALRLGPAGQGLIYFERGYHGTGEALAPTPKP
jgi:flavin reductase